MPPVLSKSEYHLLNNLPFHQIFKLVKKHKDDNAWMQALRDEGLANFNCDTSSGSVVFRCLHCEVKDGVEVKLCFRTAAKEKKMLSHVLSHQKFGSNSWLFGSRFMIVNKTLMDSLIIAII